MKAVIYHRVSTVEQDPTTARETLRLAAQARGYEVVGEYHETISGSIWRDRPELQKVMTLVRQRKVKAVFVWALDRFGRSTVDLLENIQTLHEYGCSFISVHQHLEAHPNSDASSMLMLQVLAAVSQFERQMIRDRTKLGMKRVRLHGSKSGKTIGRQYKFTKLLSRDFEKVQALRAQKKSIRVIAAELGCSKKEVENALARLKSAAK